MAVLVDDSSPSRFAAGSVRCVFSADLDSARLNLPNCVAEFAQGARLVTVTLVRFGPLDALFEEFVESLAEAALLLWPDWYDGSISIEAGANLSEQVLVDRFTARRIARTARLVNAAWLKEGGTVLRSQQRRRPPAADQGQSPDLAVLLAEEPLEEAQILEKARLSPGQLGAE